MSDKLIELISHIFCFLLYLNVSPVCHDAVTVVKATDTLADFSAAQSDINMPKSVLALGGKTLR